MEDFLNWSEEERRPKVQKKPWMEHKKMVLGTVDNLDDIIDECIKSGRYAIDLETTGLNKNSYQVTITEGRTKDQIVGVCLSPDGNVGYYLPIRHRKGEEHNIPVSRVEKALRKLVDSNSVATFHHARFDQEFLQFSGGNNPIGTWDDPKKWDDTLILTYLINTREHNKGLKHQSKVQLGFEMIEIDELFPEDHKGGYDFSELDPSWEPVLWYAASDAICTYCLYEKISPIVLKGTSERKAQDQVYLLEKMCLPATRWMERVGINIDQNVVIDLIRLGQKEFFTCLEETYDFLNANLGRKVEPGWFSLLRAKKNLDDVDFNISDQIEEFRKEAKREGMDALDEKGHFLVVKQHNGEWPEKYDILSRPQLGPLFEELEIPDLARTEKSGQVKTTQDEIDRLFQKFGDQYPFLPKIKRLGELQKALGTYLISLRRDVGPDGCLHPYYNQLGTDTGRYTTPSSDKPQLDGGTSFPVHGTPATYDTSRPACLLGIRKAVKARKGKVLAAIDFGGVELRIATNLSREPKWMKEYFHCSSCDLTFDNGDGESTPIPPPAYCPRCGSDKIGDLHTLTALAFYGEDKASTKEFKQLRQNAKCVVGNTLVLTNKGLIPIKDLNPGAKDGEQVPLEGVQVWSEHGVQAATHFWNAGVQDTVKIEVSGRYSLEGTETHRIRVYDRSEGYTWKHMGDLQVGDWVILETPSFKDLPVMDSPEAKNPWFFEGLESKFSVEDILFLSSKGVRIEQIVSIERGRGQVYDLTVPGPESFWANGFINHNSANFALAYGGGPSALMRATGCDENEGARHHRTFNQTYSVLKQWWDDTKSFAKRHGYVATAFGRQYPLPDIKLPITPAEEPDPQKREMNRKFRAKAERNATNGPIQGCIHPEERILTSLGFLPIEDLDRLGQTFMVWTGKAWSEGRVFASGLKEVRKTTLDSGRELKTSPDHRFLTWQRGVLGWTAQSELSTGDWVAINSKDISLLLGDGSEKSLWLGYGEAAPPELIKCVGEVVRESSIWATLTAPEKSAVSRLMVGSGSKPQCVKYLSRVPGSEVPAFLWDYLEYDWERVATLDNLGEQVGMFDIEVFDKEHAFVANGVVVHNCSADLTKLAMGLIYKEVKKRDWFEKVHMIISIHDELVFEIDKDILAEALEVFQDIMTRNKAVLQLKWPVPLTTDCEIGYDWTVKWNLKDFQARRVRSDGVQVDEKGNPDGKVWPEEFIRIFGSRYGFADLPITNSNTKQDEESTSNIQASQEPTTPHQESKGVTPSVAPLQVEKPQRGDSYVFQLRTLSIGVADRLAQVIVQCEGRGTNLLEIRTPTGEIIAPGPEKIYVNPLEFATVAKIHGLLG